MKKITTTLLALAALSSFGQSQQTGHVAGSIPVGNQEISVIVDDTRGCSKKTTAHQKDAFQPSEEVILTEASSSTKLEVSKAGLNDRVFIDKECPSAPGGSGKEDTYGGMHNRLVELYFEKGKTIDQYSSTNAFLQDFYQMAISEFPEVAHNDGLNILQSNFQNVQGGADIYAFLEANINLQRNQGVISTELYNFINEVVREKSFNRAITASYQLELSKVEAEKLEAFRSVLHASKKFWSQHNDGSSSNPAERDDVIIADAAATLIWWGTGPFAVVVGAAVSVGVNHTGEWA